ncbi:erythromycin esterase family protein [Bordetella genomosp. 12]|nr:erythromycin esterase family protein [Bordetella genomosp. 12]
MQLPISLRAGLSRFLVGAGVLLPWHMPIAAAEVPWQTCTPGLSRNDLQRIGNMTERARVIAYGEGSHGVHEFLAARNRLFAFLVRHHGVRLLVAETHPVNAASVDAYIQGRGELSDELVESVFTANRRYRWRDKPFDENRELLIWMRNYNAQAAEHEQIRFAGMDWRHPLAEGSHMPPKARGMAEMLLHHLQALAADKKLFVFAHHGHLRSDVSRQPPAGTPTLGQTLRQELGSQLFVLGSAYATGRVQDGGNLTRHLAPPELDSLDGRLAATGVECAILDFGKEDVRSWVKSANSVRGSYWGGTAHYLPMHVEQAFDASLFFRTVTPLR